MHEIVGAMINGGTITNCLELIRAAAKEGRINRFYDREEMEFMAALDLGENWRKMASGPTLIYIDENSKCYWEKPDTRRMVSHG